MMETHTQDKLYIGGQWIAPIDGEQNESIDPSTAKIWARVAFVGVRDIDAVSAAQEAVAGRVLGQALMASPAASTLEFMRADLIPTTKEPAP